MDYPYRKVAGTDVQSKIQVVTVMDHKGSYGKCPLLFDQGI